MTNQAIISERDQDYFERFRECFPALREKTYLSICEKSILHDDVRKGVDSYLDNMALATTDRVGHEEKVGGCREKFARLMNVDPATIAALRNVSDGINSVAWAMPIGDGDNVVVSQDAEHPNNVYPWLRLRRRGNEVRSIAPKPDGSLDIDAMIEAIDSRTKILSCATVTFAPGHRTDIARLGEACRKKDVFLLADGVQSAGILAHDLSSDPIDGFATSTSKGLLGIYGFGFLYISPKWIDRMEPAHLSRPAVLMQNDDHSTMGSYDYELQPDSRRFELGSHNIAGAYAMDVSLQLLLDLGIEAIEERVLPLSTALKEGVAALGLAPAVPSDGIGHSHIVTFGELDAGGHGFSSNHMIGPISDHLTKAKVAHTIRRGQLRFAAHAYNNEDDIDHAVSCVGEAIKSL